MIKNIDVFDLKKRIDNNESINIIDVREGWECKIAKIPDSKLIPFGILPLKMDELDRSKEYIVYCHHGTRSYFACQLLVKNGFANVLNLVGGIDEYSKKIDPAVKRY